MSNWRQILLGFSLIILFCLIAVGSITLALLEGGRAIVQAPTQTATSYIEQAFPTFINIVPGQPTNTPYPSRTPVVQKSHTPTITPKCPLPEGWIEIILQPGDTLHSLATKFGMDPATLAHMNCMFSETLIYGATIYVPGPPYMETSTASPAPTLLPSQIPSQLPPTFPSATKPIVICGPPPTWVLYSIQPKDTLYQLSQVLGVSISWLQYANCMGASTHIYVGQLFWVPFYPPPPTQKPILHTNTPTMTATTTCEFPPTLTYTAIPESTPTATFTPSQTPSPTITVTDSISPSQTSTPTFTHTPDSTSTSP